MLVLAKSEFSVVRLLLLVQHLFLLLLKKIPFPQKVVLQVNAGLGSLLPFFAVNNGANQKRPSSHLDNYSQSVINAGRVTVSSYSESKLTAEQSITLYCMCFVILNSPFLFSASGDNHVPCIAHKPKGRLFFACMRRDKKLVYFVTSMPIDIRYDQFLAKLS